jgi:hypothetical protein
LIMHMVIIPYNSLVYARPTPLTCINA